MGKAIDLSGCKFGRLLVIKQAESRIGRDGKPRRRWECLCDCGKTILATTQDLRKGDVKSCGCLHDDVARASKTIHGDSGSKLHNIWCAMRRRCSDTGQADYKYYGERGISVCAEWNESYQAFKEWALNNGYIEGLTIDRIDVNGDYAPDNCKWSTMKQQSNNRTSNIKVTHDGVTRTLMEWSEIYDIPYTTLYMRLRGNKSFEDAIHFNRE